MWMWESHRRMISWCWRNLPRVHLKISTAKLDQIEWLFIGLSESISFRVPRRRNQCCNRVFSLSQNREKTATDVAKNQISSFYFSLARARYKGEPWASFFSQGSYPCGKEDIPVKVACRDVGYPPGAESYRYGFVLSRCTVWCLGAWFASNEKDQEVQPHNIQ